MCRRPPPWRYRPAVPLTDDVGPPRAFRVRHWLRTAWWWAITVVTLVVLDDLTFGPAFWAIARLLSAEAAVAAVLITYIPVQVFIVHRATSPEPGRFAAFFLNRLALERRSERIAAREKALHGKVVGAVSGTALTLVIGGVLPPLILWRTGYPTVFVRRLSWVTASLYAAEFAVLHAIVPASI